METLSLNLLSPGERGVIQRINTATVNVRRRLLEMGLIKGTTIEVVGFAPTGDPIEVRVRGYRLSLRRLEAQAVLILRELGT